MRKFLFVVEVDECSCPRLTDEEYRAMLAELKTSSENLYSRLDIMRATFSVIGCGMKKQDKQEYYFSEDTCPVCGGWL